MVSRETHLLESLPTGDAALAVRWAERAAADAMAHLAWEDAAGFYDRALRAAAVQGAADWCRLLRGLGVAQLRSFDLAAATGTLREAADTARTAGDPVLIGEVALAMEGFADPAWLATGRQLCDEALARLPAADSPLRARLLAQRAAEASYHWEPGAAPLSGQALAMAERVADPHALRSALRARQMARAGPDGVRDRLELGARMLALGVADGDDDAVLSGRLWRLDAFTQLGRISEADADSSAGPHRGPAAVTHRELASAGQPGRAGLRPRAVRPGAAPHRGIRPDRGPPAHERARAGGVCAGPDQRDHRPRRRGRPGAG